MAKFTKDDLLSVGKSAGKFVNQALNAANKHPEAMGIVIDARTGEEVVLPSQQAFKREHDFLHWLGLAIDVSDLFVFLIGALYAAMTANPVALAFLWGAAYTLSKAKRLALSPIGERLEFMHEVWNARRKAYIQKISSDPEIKKKILDQARQDPRCSPEEYAKLQSILNGQEEDEDE